MASGWTRRRDTRIRGFATPVLAGVAVVDGWYGLRYGAGPRSSSVAANQARRAGVYDTVHCDDVSRSSPSTPGLRMPPALWEAIDPLVYAEMRLTFSD
jgi:hypothetical protein